MIRISAIMIAAICLACLASTAGRAADPAYDLTITADTTKANGSPWDGVPGLGNSKANLNAPPDIAVCLVRANANPECLWRPEGRRLFSNCQNAWGCKFKSVALRPLPIGVVVIDIDARNHDVIDTMILTDKTDEAANAAISDSLRAAMTVLTPNRSEDTKERLARNAKVLPIKDCASGQTCRLNQSTFKLELAKE